MIFLCSYTTWSSSEQLFRVLFRSIIVKNKYFFLNQSKNVVLQDRSISPQGSKSPRFTVQVLYLFDPVLILTKNLPRYKDLSFIYNKEICPNFDSFSNMTWQWKNKNLLNFLSRRDFDWQFFLKSYFLKLFQLKN